MVVVSLNVLIKNVSFVLQERLFPYFLENVETYLKTNYNKAETKADITSLRDLVCISSMV